MTKRPSPVRKRSLFLGAKQTSVSMEDEFWQALTEIAKRRGVSRTQVVREVEERRTVHKLSSALRIFILEHYRKHSRS